MATAPEVAPVVSRGPDILIRTAPPLSATSDGPLGEVAKPPVSASNDAGDQDSGVPGEMSAQDQADARTAKVTDVTAPTGKKPPAAKTPEAEIDVSDLASNLPGYAVREISKARKAARTQVAEATAQADAAAKSATEAADAARAELAALRAKLQATPPAESEPAVNRTEAEGRSGGATRDPSAEARPTRDTFDDPDAYDTALSEWAMREGVRTAEAKIASDRAAAEAAAQKSAQEAEIAALNTRWEASKAKASEKYQDYAAVAEGEHTVSVPMAHAILVLENGTDVAYHLGKNPEESARIAAIKNPMMQVLEIGKIAARLAAPPSRAPRSRPLEPIDGSFSPADTSGREPSMEEVAARVNGRYQAGRRPFLEASPGRH